MIVSLRKIMVLGVQNPMSRFFMYRSEKRLAVFYSFCKSLSCRLLKSKKLLNPFLWRHNLTFCVLINNRILSGKLFVLRGGLASPWQTPWHVENKGTILRHFLTCNIPHNNVVSRWKIAQATSFSGTNLMWVAARNYL